MKCNFGVLVSLFFALLLTCASKSFAQTLDDVSYINAVGHVEKRNGVIEYSNDSAAEIIGQADETTWYFVRGQITLTGPVTILGNVNLILENECSFSINSTVRRSATVIIDLNDKLNIYAQSQGEEMGSMTINTYVTSVAAICSASNEPGGDISINGGKITTNGGVLSNNITISDGAITVNSTSAGSVGLGVMAWEVTESQITISGGTVTISNNGDDFYGISSNFISIMGGAIITNGGINGGTGIIGKNISISDGSVTAFSEAKSAYGVWCETIIINGENTMVSLMGGLYGYDLNCINLTIGGGAQLNLNEDGINTENMALLNCVIDGIGAGKLAGRYDSEGKLHVFSIDKVIEQFDISDNKITIAPTADPDIIRVSTATQIYTIPNNAITLTSSASKGSVNIKKDTKVKITLNNVDVEALVRYEIPAFNIQADAKVDLFLEGESTMKSSVYQPALNVHPGATLTIEGDGTLIATGEQENVCGISGGNIIINSGTVTAIGGNSESAIGGENIHIKINGGIVLVYCVADIAGNVGYGIASGNGLLEMDANGVLFVSTINIENNILSGILFVNQNDEKYLGEVYGNVTIQKNLTIPLDAQLKIKKNASMTIPPEITVHNNGEIHNEGLLINKGSLIGTEKIFHAVNVSVLGGNGMLTPISDGANVESECWIQHGKSLKLIATPNSEYCVQRWINNNISITSADSTFLIDSVINAHNIQVEFQLVPVSFLIESKGKIENNIATLTAKISNNLESKILAVFSLYDNKNLISSTHVYIDPNTKTSKIFSIETTIELQNPVYKLVIWSDYNTMQPLVKNYSSQKDE